MSDVKRYEPLDGGFLHAMTEVGGGEWVRHTDYKALVLRLEQQAKLALDMADAAVRESDKVLALRSRLNSVTLALLSIRNTPPTELDSIDGKGENWWYRLVKDMRDQAAEAYGGVVERHQHNFDLDGICTCGATPTTIANGA